jgi:F-type H+-transporting ATPase subunit epsilon
MVERLNLQIITPERVVVSEEVDMIEACGALGEFGVLPGHVEYLTTLDIGEIRFMQGQTTRHIATSGGFAEVADDNATFFVDTAEFAEEIDVERAKRAMERAEAALKGPLDDDNQYKIHELALKRAIARIGAASKKI